MKRPVKIVVTIRTVLAGLVILACGCGSHRDLDAIDLGTALKNTRSGEYSLVAVFEAEGARFVSFQKSWDHKRQFYFEQADRSVVLAKVFEAIEEARGSGHKIETAGGEDILDRENRSN